MHQNFSTKQGFKEFEQNVDFPLETDQYFQTFKLGCQDPKYKAKFLAYGKTEIF